jgi:hypothetical protein
MARRGLTGISSRRFLIGGWRIAPGFVQSLLDSVISDICVLFALLTICQAVWLDDPITFAVERAYSAVSITSYLLQQLSCLHFPQFVVLAAVFSIFPLLPFSLRQLSIRRIVKLVETTRLLPIGNKLSRC